MRAITLVNKQISDFSQAYVIAEVGHNHGGDVGRAKELVSAAREAGASAVKLQKRQNATLYTRQMYNQPYGGRNSFGATYGEHREFLEFDRAEYEVLIAYAADIGIDFFATAFDEASVDFLVSFGLGMLKIASADLTNSPLLRHAARAKLPLIVSTGGAALDDVIEAHRVLKSEGADFALLQCTAAYPAPAELLNINVISTYRGLFPTTVIGYSGHDVLRPVPPAAYALGARIFERHFTLDRSARGSDHHFSMTPEDLRELVADLATVRAALGSPVKNPVGEERAALNKMAKTMVTTQDLDEGTVLTEAHLVARTSGHEGISPSRLSDLLGGIVTRRLPRGHILTLADFDAAEH